MNKEPIFSFVLRNLESNKGRLKEVSVSSKVPYSTICKITQGITNNPGVLVIQRLADYFDKAA